MVVVADEADANFGIVWLVIFDVPNTLYILLYDALISLLEVGGFFEECDAQEMSL